MNRLLHFLLLFFVGFALQAQILVPEGQVLEGYGSPEDTKLTVDLTVEAGSTDVGNFLWEVIRPETMSDSWVFSICDQVTCYIPGIESCPPANPNMLAPGSELTFNIYLHPNMVEGQEFIDFRLFSADDPTVTLATSQIYYDVKITSNTEDEFTQQDMQLYPNPASEYFQITNDTDVAHVSVHTIVGREVFRYNHEAGQAYSINTLNSGLYMARLVDAKGETIKVIRFNKK